ncbi:MAG: hypothetical protein LBK60_10745 [Verrucomicrobiales bacterium]|nr:hypothetical protein [Verrucomicrobiales bacterium]
MLTVSGARAQWLENAPTLDISDTNNWANGEVNFVFYYSGTERRYDLGELAFAAGAQSNILTDLSGVLSLNALKGYKVYGTGVSGNLYLAEAKTDTGAPSVSGTLNFNRQTSGASGGTYYLSNYGPDLTLPTLTFDAGATTLYTGTYDARQMVLGTPLIGAGLAPGTYVTGVTNSGAITINQPTTGAASGSYTVSGLRPYDKQITNVTYSGDVAVPDNFVYIHTGNYANTIQNAGAGRLVFENPDAKFIVVNGASGDQNFTISGSLNFTGNATFAVNYGLLPSYSNTSTYSFNAMAQNIAGNTNLILNATTDIEGDFIRVGTGNFRLRGGATGNVILHGGNFNIMESNVWSEIAGQALTAPRIQGASAINIVGAPLRNTSYSYLLVHVGEVNAGNISADYNMLDGDMPINLYSGMLAFSGLGAGHITGQKTGDVTAVSSRNAIGFNSAATLNGFTATLKSLHGSAAGLVSLFTISNTYGALSGNTGRVVVTNDGNLTTGGLVGTASGTDYGATNIAILPWAAASNTAENTGYNGRVADFVTYVSGSDYGFRRLADNEYHVGFTGAAKDDNVRLDAAATVSVSTTINALKIASGSEHVINDDLLISSGVMLNYNANGVFSGNNSMISSGSRAMILTGWGNSYEFKSGVMLHNTVSGTDIGLHIATPAVFRNANSIGGTVLISTVNSAGINVELNNDGAFSLDNTIHVNSNARLVINTSNASFGGLSGNGMIYSNNATNRINIGDKDMASDIGHLVVHDGGFISPGDFDGPSQASALYIGKNILSVDFLTGAVLKLDLAGAGVSDMLSVYTLEDTYYRPTAPVALTFEDDAIIQLNLLFGYTPAGGDTWLLASGFGTVSAETADWSKVLLQDSAGLDLSGEWSLFAENNNLFLTTIIPEPGVWTLLAIGGAILALTMKRRRR